jgi:hypothetical protein
MARPNEYEKQQDANQKRGLKTSKSQFLEQSLLKLALSVYHAAGASSQFEGPSYTDIKQIFDEQRLTIIDKIYYMKQSKKLPSHPESCARTGKRLQAVNNARI